MKRSGPSSVFLAILEIKPIKDRTTGMLVSLRDPCKLPMATPLREPTNPLISVLARTYYQYKNKWYNIDIVDWIYYKRIRRYSKTNSYSLLLMINRDVDNNTWFAPSVQLLNFAINSITETPLLLGRRYKNIFPNSKSLAIYPHLLHTVAHLYRSIYRNRKRYR